MTRREPVLKGVALEQPLAAVLCDGEALLVSSMLLVVVAERVMGGERVAG